MSGAAAAVDWSRFVEIATGLFYEIATGLPWSNRSRTRNCVLAPLTGTDKAGYRMVCLKRATHRSHMAKWTGLVWQHFHGSKPPGLEIDHKDNVRGNDRIDNLRLRTRVANVRRQKISKRNKSGFPGVHWKTQDRKWVAALRLSPKTLYLGSFDDPLLAFRTYVLAKIQHHGAEAVEPILSLIQTHCPDLIPK